MFRSIKSKVAKLDAGYANAADFCGIFHNEMKPLYLLAFLLTANHQKSEQCFISTVDQAFQEQPVFKEFAVRWVRRKLIENAIQMVSPVSAQNNEKRDLWDTRQSQSPRKCAIGTITNLDAFHRCVFVMSFVERFSTWECALLLNSKMSKVAQAQMKALRRIPDLVAKRGTIEASSRSDGIAVVRQTHEMSHRHRGSSSMEV